MKEQTKVEKLPLFHPKARRLHMIFLCLLGVFNSNYMNVNLSLTITCMTNSTAVALLEQPGLFTERVNNVMLVETNDSTVIEEIIDSKTSSNADTCQTASADGKPIILDYGGSLIWDRKVQNFLFSANFWGSIVMVIPSVFLVQKLNPRITFLICIANKSLMNLIIPYVSVHYGFYATFMARFMMGIGEPFIYPSINMVLSRWFPVQERSTALALFTTGNQLSLLIGNPIAAFFCKSQLGWPAVFYFSACLGSIWCVLWSIFSSNTPAECKVMTQRERDYLEAEIPTVTKKATDKKEEVPWSDIITNKAFIVQVFASVTVGVVATFNMVYLPSFFKEVLLLGVIANGTFTSIPPLFMLSFKLIWGVTVDKMKESKCLTPTQGVKISQFMATVCVAMSFLVLTFVADCSRPLASLGVLCIMQMFLGAHTSGAYTSLLSLAPRYTASLSSLSTAIGQLGHVSTPYIVGALKTSNSPEDWNRVIYTMIVMLCASGTAFSLYGSGDIQPFARERNPALPEPEEEVLLQQVRMQNLASESLQML